MRLRLKSMVSGLAFCVVWWAIYRGLFARIVDGVVVAALAGGIVWMTWDLYTWMYRERVLGPTELAVKPQFPRAVFGLPFAVLFSTLVIFVSGWRSGKGGRWEGLALVVGGIIGALWSAMLVGSTEFRVSGLACGGRVTPWDEVGQYKWASMLGEERVLVLTAKPGIIGWRVIPIPISVDELPKVESILTRHSVGGK